MKIFKKYFSAKKRERDKKDYERGFDFAAGSLIRGEYTPSSLQNLTYGSCHPFDRGINTATDFLIKNNIVIDDRKM